MLAIQYQLDHSQWWPAATLGALQMRQIEKLIGHAAETVPFYRGRLRSLAGVRSGALTLDLFRRIPVMGRADIQDAGPALNSRKVPKDHGKTGVARSSGSTGRPVTVKTTAITELFFAALNLRFHLWHGHGLSAEMAAIRGLGDKEAELARTGKPSAWLAGHSTGPMWMFDITRPVGEQLEWLVRRDPEYLLTHPSNLRALLERCEKDGVALPRLKEVNTMTEIIDGSLREQCRRVWGVPIADTYSAMEVGFIALQCPDHPHYHVQDESLLVEVLDDDGEPCAPGRIGRVVLTDLHNFATPLIRYEIGDYAEVGEPCPCGRGLRVLARILGRTRNMVTFPGGDKAWPLPYWSRELLAAAPLRQIQFIQRSLDEIVVKLAVERHLTEREEDGLRELFLRRLGHPFKLRFVYVDEIPRSAGGKYEDFVSEIEEMEGGAKGG